MDRTVPVLWLRPLLRNRYRPVVALSANGEDHGSTVSGPDGQNERLCCARKIEYSRARLIAGRQAGFGPLSAS